MTTLYDVLSNGYKDKKKKSKNLNGYVMDEQLPKKHIDFINNQNSNPI